MSNLSVYYVSRTLLALAFGALFLAAGLPWWAAGAITAALIAFFLWAPTSGRYAIKTERGVAPMRKDEYGQEIRNQAARDAFIVTTLAMAGTILYGFLAQTDVSIALLGLVLGLGWLSYFVSDFWQRRTGS
jgi:hypothetical protein